MEEEIESMGGTITQRKFALLHSQGELPAHPCRTGLGLGSGCREASGMGEGECRVSISSTQREKTKVHSFWFSSYKIDNLYPLLMVYEHCLDGNCLVGSIHSIAFSSAVCIMLLGAGKREG